MQELKLGLSLIQPVTLHSGLAEQTKMSRRSCLMIVQQGKAARCSLWWIPTTWDFGMLGSVVFCGTIKNTFFIILHVSQDGKVHNSLVPLDLVHSLTGAENVFVYVFVYTNMKDWKCHHYPMSHNYNEHMLYVFSILAPCWCETLKPFLIVPLGT